MRIVALILLLLCQATISFGQSAKELENRMVRHLAGLDKWSNYGPSVDYDKLEAINKALKNDLIRSGRSVATLSYRFPRLKEKMFITTSKDGRLRIYSWDEETGGTMHDFDSVFQFKGQNGKVYTWAPPPTDEYDFGGFFHDIFQLKSRSGPVYLAVSTTIGSTSLAGQTISAYKVDGSSLKPNVIIRTASGVTDSIGFAFDFFSVVDRPERPIRLFSFDEATQSFKFPVVIEDKKTPQGRVTDRFIRYRFNGTYFVKVN